MTETIAAAGVHTAAGLHTEGDRRIPFEGIANARDLGGLISGGGSRVRRGCLIRSANLSRATQADVAKLTEEYRLCIVADLRTSMAAGMKPDVKIEGVAHQALPVFEDAMIGVTHESDRDYAHRKKKMPDMRDLYRMMVTAPECRKNFGRILTMIMQHDFDRGSVLWHCSEGKDRCGLVSAFLLSALDVSRDQIVGDYMITNETALSRAEWYYHQVLQNGGTEEVARSVYDAFVVKEEYLLSAFEMIESQYGSIAGYIREGLGVDRDVIGTFRQVMLVS